MTLGDFSKLVNQDDQNIHFTLGKDKYTQRPINSVPVFSYRDASLGNKSGLCFDQDCIEKIHFLNYFKQVKRICQFSIDDLTGMRNQNGIIRFSIDSQPNKLIKDALSKLAGKNLNPEEIPETGHFHISNQAKEEGQISERPVIHFYIGDKGIFYILFFDLKHIVHPTNH